MLWKVYLCWLVLIIHVWSKTTYIWGCHDLIFGGYLFIFSPHLTGHGSKLRLLLTLWIFSKIDAIRLATINRRLRMFRILFHLIILYSLWFLCLLVKCAGILLKWVFVNAWKRWSDFRNWIFLGSCSFRRFWRHNWLFCWRCLYGFGELTLWACLHLWSLFDFYKSLNWANIFTENVILKVLGVVNSYFVSWPIHNFFILEGFIKITTPQINLWRCWIALNLIISTHVLVLFCFLFKRRRLITLFVDVVLNIIKFLFKLTYFCGLLIGSLMSIKRITSSCILIRILINIVINYFIIFRKFVSGWAADVVGMRHN